jgi:hypothetical protein
MWLTPSNWTPTSHVQTEPDATELADIKTRIKNFVTARGDRMSYDELRKKLSNAIEQGLIPAINKRQMTEILDAVEAEYRDGDT